MKTAMIQLHSPNFKKGRDGHSIKYITLHAACGSWEGTKSWLCSPKSNVSAHFIVNIDGQVAQLVNESDTAWHCYGFNSTSIGIEHIDNNTSMTNPKWVTLEMLHASARLTATLLKKYNLPLDGVVGHNSKFIQDYAKLHNPAMAHQDPGNFFPWGEYKDLVAVFMNAK